MLVLFLLRALSDTEVTKKTSKLNSKGCQIPQWRNGRHKLLRSWQTGGERGDKLKILQERKINWKISELVKTFQSH